MTISTRAGLGVTLLLLTVNALIAAVDAVNPPGWLVLLVSALLGIGTIAIGWWGHKLTQQRNKAQTESETVKAQADLAISATAFAEQIQIRLGAVETELAAKDRRINGLESEIATMRQQYATLEERYQLAVRANSANEARIQRQDEAIRLLLSLLERLGILLRQRGVLDAELSAMIDPVQVWRVLSGMAILPNLATMPVPDEPVRPETPAEPIEVKLPVKAPRGRPRRSRAMDEDTD